MKTKKQKWILVQYDKYQTGSRKTGKIILEQSTANGFIERIMKDKFDEFVFEIQRKDQYGTYGLKIGSYVEDEANKDINEKIAEKVKMLPDLLDLINDKNSEAHIDYYMSGQGIARANNIKKDKSKSI